MYQQAWDWQLRVDLSVWLCSCVMYISSSVLVSEGQCVNPHASPKDCASSKLASEECEAENEQAWSLQSKLISMCQSNSNWPSDELPSRMRFLSWFTPRSRLSMCQFHSCADFDHYTLRYSCVHHLIPHVEPSWWNERVRRAPCFSLVSFSTASLPAITELSGLIHDHSCLSEKPIKT